MIAGLLKSLSRTVLFALIYGVAASASAATATSLAIAAGNNQTATAGTPVHGVVCVLVSDAGHNPVAGVTVTFGNVSGGGSITGAVQVSGTDGIVTLGSWTLGSAPGLNTLNASSAGLNTLTFTATAVGVAASRIAIAAGNNQIALPGAALSGPVCVIALDSTGNPVPGIDITWGNITGGGTLTGSDQLTQSNGIATLGGWTLGAAPGQNTITATAPGLNSLLFTATATSDSNQENAIIRWDSAVLRAIADESSPPTVAARAIAMVHTAMFDAWAAYDSKAVGTQLGSKLRRPSSEQTTANKEIATSYAAYRVLLDLFPDQQSAFVAELASQSLDPTNQSSDTTTPIGIGNTAASELLNVRHNDGSNQLGALNPGAYSDYTSYAPVNAPGSLTNPSRWQPLLVNGTVQQFVTPQWGLVAPFAIGAQSARKSLLPKPPAASPGMPYTKETQTILTSSAGLTDRQKTTVVYWDDGPGTVTPPGHWCQIGQYVSTRDFHTIDDDAKMFFILGNALLDAGIEVWDSKRHFDAVRPISAVQFLFNNKSVQAWGGPGLGTQTIQGQNFQSYVPTPAFPEYVSEHSAFSAAASAVLTTFTKKKTFGMVVGIAAGSSPIEPGAVPAQSLTLTWKAFMDAANEAGMSRQYAGVQFNDGDLNGRKLGGKIASVVYKQALLYITGKAK